MYEIYYNDKILRLLPPAIQSYYKKKGDESLDVFYPGKVKHIHSYLDKVEKNAELKEINIYYADVKRLKEDFFSAFKIVEAAGGLVLNKSGDILMMFRRGSWDLPKGKLDPGETKKQAAIREVQEETGLHQVTLVSKLITTYHIYRTKHHKNRILKPSHWYVMTTVDNKIVPQVEEDIELVEWVSLKEALKVKKPIYPSIYTVLKRFDGRL